MNTAGKGSIMQELTKCKQNVLPPLNWRSTWLNVALCAHTRGERGGVSCGSVSICSEPHPALYCVCTLTPHPLNMTLSCSPRAENKQLYPKLPAAPPCQLSCSAPPSCCFGKTALSHMAKKKNKSTTEKINKQDQLCTTIFFISIY